MKIKILTPLLVLFAYSLFAQNISIGTISSPVCAGITINLPFTISGTFDTSNVYTVQLSDSNGHFSNPDTIGNLYDNTYGNISCNLPENTLQGTGYLVRIVSSSPAIISSSSNAITIKQAPMPSDFQLNSLTTPCQGSNAIINVTSTSLMTDVYTIYYNLRGGMNLIGDSASMNFLAGSPGSFSTILSGTTDTSFLSVVRIRSATTGCMSKPGSGTVYTVLHTFTQSTGDGGNGEIIQATNGLLYGVTSVGGANNGGTIFKFDLATNTYTKVFDFINNNSGYQPDNLIQASNGILYGKTYSGGLNNLGVLFQFNPANNAFAKLHDFTISTGSYPYYGLVQTSSGFLYGTASRGGTFNDGVIFKYDIANSLYDTVYNFSSFNGLAAVPNATLYLASNGLLYGTAGGGGANNLGAIFQFNPVNNIYDTSYSFQYCNSNSLNPEGGVTEANNELFYGVTYFGGVNTLGNIYSWNSHSKKYKDIFDFNSLNGVYPIGRLTKANDGSLYGMTQGNGGLNHGTLFKINPLTNTVKSLLYFDSLNTSIFGYNKITQASNGLFYGETETSIFEYGALGKTTIVPIPVYAPTISVLDSSCNGSPAILLARCSGDTAASFMWSNGAVDSIITISQSGYDSVRVLTTQGCLTPYSHSIPLPVISHCGGLLLLQSDSIINFDTLQVNVLVENADSLFSISGYLRFDSSLLKLIKDTIGNFYGPSPNNLVIHAPGTGLIDFEIASSTPHVGLSGNGLLYTFYFKLISLPNSISTNAPFSAFTILTITNPSVLDADGNQRIVKLPKADSVRIGAIVWPGDLNDDGVVNVLDILPIGYFYLFNGPARSLYCSPNCNQWVGQPAQIWGPNIYAHNSSAYETFADANGDGVINLGDASDVQFNLGSIHALQPKSNGPTNARLLNPPLATFTSATQIDSTQFPYTLNVSVNLGSPSMPVEYVLGIAFDLLFDAECIDTNSLTPNSVTYSNLFGTYQSDYIRVTDFTHKAEGKISFGLTRFGVPPISGNGDSILNVSFKLVNGCTGGYFRIAPYLLGCDSADGGPILLSTIGDSVKVIATGPSAINTVKVESLIKIFPNPANDLITIYSPGNVSSTITLYDVNGQIILTQNFNGTMKKIDVSRLAPGVYIVNVRNSSETSTQKIIKE